MQLELERFPQREVYAGGREVYVAVCHVEEGCERPDAGVVDVSEAGAMDLHEIVAVELLGLVAAVRQGPEAQQAGVHGPVEVGGYPLVSDPLQRPSADRVTTRIGR
eukprot:282628-Rhodomonas_salina.1